MKISIPEPCNEDWQKMLPHEKGRFCLNCQKTVVDFTNKSNQEIINYLKNHKNVCGRLNNTQLNKYLKPERNTTIAKWHTYFLSLMAFVGIELAHAQDVKKQNITIKGKVIDKEKYPIPGVSIVLDRDKKTGAISDADGLFSFEIPQQDSLSKIEIIGVGFRDTSFVVKAIPNDWIVELISDEETVEIIVTAGFVCIDHSTFWQKIKKWFRREKHD
jgi:CarboxypepD_reg-like domain